MYVECIMKTSLLIKGEANGMLFDGKAVSQVDALFSEENSTTL